MRNVYAALSIGCLAVCVAAPVLCFLGRLDEVAYKNILAAASLGWFVFATAWGARGTRA
jgi:hypothetical protein